MIGFSRPPDIVIIKYWKMHLYQYDKKLDHLYHHTLLHTLTQTHKLSVNTLSRSGWWWRQEYTHPEWDSRPSQITLVHTYLSLPTAIFLSGGKRKTQSEGMKVLHSYNNYINLLENNKLLSWVLLLLLLWLLF